MSDTVKADMRLIECGRDIVARRGDKLMIVVGLCVGVYTGQRPADPKKAEAGRKKPRPKAKGAKHLPEKKVGPKVVERRAAILKVLEDRGGTAGPDEFKAAGIGRDNEPYTYDAALHTLLREGIVSRSGGTQRKAVFTLSRPNGAEAPPA